MSRSSRRALSPPRRFRAGPTSWSASRLRPSTPTQRVKSTPPPGRSDAPQSRKPRHECLYLGSSISATAVAVLGARHQPCRVSRHQIYLEIDVITGGQRAECRDFYFLRYDQHREGVVSHLIDSERHSVERDGALGRDETDKLCRRVEGEPRHVGQILARHHCGKSVGMASDDMPAEFVTHLERALEVEARAPLPGPNRGHTQGLRGGINGEPGAVAVPSAPHHRQADAAASDRCADGNRFRIVAASDLEPGQTLGARLDGNNLADIGDDTSEHLTSARTSRSCPPRPLRYQGI